MKDWKAIGRKLLFPPLWVIIILAIFSAAALVTVFVKGLDTSPIAYAIYVLSFYSLLVICIAGYFTFPRYFKSLKQKIYNTKYGNRYMTDVAFKTHVNLYISLGINLLYVAANPFWGYWYQTVWFTIFAVYYSILAMYTFYVTTFAIINLIKYRKYNSPIMTTAKVIDLAAALISMLALETAMLSQFGAENSPQFRRIMVASTGGGVSIIIVTMAVYMIVRANREIKEI